MAIKITKVSEQIDRSGLKVLIHGPAGAGKTVMAATAGEKTLIVSAESGLLSLEGCPDYIDVVEVNNLDELAEVYQMLKTTDHGYSWVALDSISEIGEVCLAAEKGENRDARAAYGNMIDNMTVMLKRFRDLKMNVMMTCKQARTQDEDTKRVSYGPSLPGARLANDLPYLFDLVCALRVEQNQEGEVYRVLQTGTDLRYIAKDRSGKLEMFEEPNLKSIHDKVFPNGVTKPVVEEKAEEPLPETEPERAPRYFYHPESEDVIVLKDGEDLTTVMENDCVEMDLDEYEGWLKSKEQ